MRKFRMLLFAAATTAVWCQTQAEFEVISVKANHSGGPNTQIDYRDPTRFIDTNANLQTPIRNCFAIMPHQIAGGPPWKDHDRFDIVATTGPAAKITPQLLPPLLLSLLVQRFNFRFHREMREFAIYALVPAKNGPKLQASTAAAEPSCNTRKASGIASMKCTQMSLAAFVKHLGPLDRVVVDKTGLSGPFDLSLEWSTDQTPDATAPSIFTALQEQLGLKLEATKGPIEVIVVDHAEKASEN